MPDRITIRMTPEMIVRIDAWIAAQPGYVSRQEAVRRFVDVALDHPVWSFGEEDRRSRSSPSAGTPLGPFPSGALTER